MSVTVSRRPAPAAACPSGRQPETACEVTLERRPEMTRRARRFLRRTATKWSVDEDAAQAAELVVSELFTNAVRHTCADRIRLCLRRHHALLYVEVFDREPHRRLEALCPAPDAEDGRGLLIVESLCLGWGRRPDRDGSLTWACLSAPGGEPEQHERVTDPEQPQKAGSLPRPVASTPAHPASLSFEGDLVPPSPPHDAPTLYESWEALADGLHVQRLALHLPQLRDQLSTTAAAASGLAAGALTARPAELRDAQAEALVDGAGLTGWVRLPAEHGTPDTEASPLAGAAGHIESLLLDGLPDDAPRAAVRAVSAASAWWVGAFAAIRHLGVHHARLTPIDDTVGLDTLREAVRVVALGTAQRILAHHLRHDAADEAVRLAYCRAVTEGIVTEPTLPALLKELGELRLVDLVATSIPWRGRFTKYAGGTGAGQVE
ncbi:ATP-binding protein [Streptomyces sp. CC208A]|uniref:ATP-binding protein n=1 Tax=Streptomyces sp. CC208A TaxID=3044573 RepID=UPI0024A81391|nr:ATP-binding protein [Streptomyces sp. CC208A]